MSRRDTPRRNRKVRERKQSILIVCEGRETERLYLDALKRTDAVTRRLNVTVYGGKGGSRENIAQIALDKQKEFARKLGSHEDVVYYCVMDVETHDQRAGLNNAIKTLEDAGFVVILSNPCFEVWFLAHFAKTGQPFLNADAVVSRLNEEWQEKLRKTFSKTDRDHYAVLADFTETACTNAEWVKSNHHQNEPTVDANSSTDMYQLIRFLLPNREPDDASA